MELLNTRIRNKAVIARLLYKMPDAKIPVRMALTTARWLEECFYFMSIDEHDYRRMVTDYMKIIPPNPETFQAALAAISEISQICPDLSEETSWEAIMLCFWILLEGLSWEARAQTWPKFDQICEVLNSQSMFDRLKLEQQQSGSNELQKEKDIEIKAFIDQMVQMKEK